MYLIKFFLNIFLLINFFNISGFFFTKNSYKKINKIEDVDINQDIKIENAKKIIRLLNSREQINNALVLVCDKDDIDFLNTLLTYGANPDTVDSDGVSCLEKALISRKIENIKILLKYKAKVNNQSIFGYTSFHSIIIYFDTAGLEVIKILLSNNNDPLDVNIQDNSGNTYLIYCLEEIIKLKDFYNFEGTINDENCFKKKYNLYKNTIKLLLYYGANPYTRNKSNKSSIDIAQENELFEISILMQNAKEKLRQKLTLLLSRGQSPFNKDIAKIIANFRYNY